MVVRNYNHGQLGNCTHRFDSPRVLQPSPSSPLVMPPLSAFAYLHHASRYLLWFSWIFVVNKESRTTCVREMFPVLVSSSNP